MDITTDASCQNSLPPEVHVLLLERPTIGLTLVRLHKHPIRWRQGVLIRWGDPVTQDPSTTFAMFEDGHHFGLGPSLVVRFVAISWRRCSSTRNKRFFIAFCGRMGCRETPKHQCCLMLGLSSMAGAAHAGAAHHYRTAVCEKY